MCQHSPIILAWAIKWIWKFLTNLKQMYFFLNTLHLTMILRYVNNFVAPTAQTKEVFDQKLIFLTFVLLISHTDDLKKNRLATHLLAFGFWLWVTACLGRTLSRTVFNIFITCYEKIRRSSVCSPSFKKQSTNPV